MTILAAPYAIERLIRDQAISDDKAGLAVRVFNAKNEDINLLTMEIATLKEENAALRRDLENSLVPQ